jgi:CTP:molybdopterin cytidylyltransferase MocA/SAM-dependent methyltransferase
LTGRAADSVAGRDRVAGGEDGIAGGRDGIAAVVLAAGAGSRFGGGKLLAPLDGRPILQHVLDRLAAAGIDSVVVVLGEDAPAVEAAIDWRDERRVRNPDPGRGLSSSLQVGIGALEPSVETTLIVLGDQPLLPARAIRAVLDVEADPSRPVVVPVYGDDDGRNPVRLDRAAFPLVDAAIGDRGLGPVLAAHPELVREIPVRIERGNPDVDTPADLVALLEAEWSARVRANAEQVDRFREVPDGADFYAPVTGLFRADPRRTDEPVLDILLSLVEPGETWLDIGAGAGRYALPIALALAPSGGRVIAVDPSHGMLDALIEIQSEHGVTDVEVVETRWPPADAELGRFAADVALIAHVGYDIDGIGAFVGAMEAVSSRLCVAVLMERQPASVADPCWPPVHGEARVALPALPEFVELLRARGRTPQVRMTDREARRFASRGELEGFLRRQLWVEEGSEADARFQAALDSLLVIDDKGRVGLRDQRSLPIGVVTWSPRDAS